MTIISAARYLAMACAIVLVNACTTTAPSVSSQSDQKSSAVKNRSYNTSYDKAWAVLIATLQEEDMNLNALDKSSGAVNGIKNLTPSTGDMLMGYSVRMLISTTIAEVKPGEIAINIRGTMERKYKKAEWRPDATDASPYIQQLYTKLDSRLPLRKDANHSSAAPPTQNNNLEARNPSDVKKETRSPDAPVSVNRAAQTSSSVLTKQTVIDAQLKLSALGLNPGTADGVFGAKSKAALRQFQSMRGIPATGELTQETLKALGIVGNP